MSSSIEKVPSKFEKFFKDWIIPIAIAAIAATMVRRYLLFKVYIPSESMYPTLTKGDQLFVTKIYNYDKIKRGDVLVFTYNQDGKEETLIKRVIGLPGDKIEINNQGEVFINGEKRDEPYIQNPSPKTGSFQVPEGKYLFLGDNRRESYDSRFWKNPYIDQGDVIAKARILVYPFDRIKLIK